MRKTIAIGLLVLMLLPAVALADNTVQGTVGGSTAITKCDGRGRCITTHGATETAQVRIFDPGEGNSYYMGQRGIWHIYQSTESYKAAVKDNKAMKEHLQALYNEQLNYDRNAWVKQTLANLAKWQNKGPGCNVASYDNSANQCSSPATEVVVG